KKQLPSGDYWYIIEINDNLDKRKFKGNFTLYR
ncbi:gliding motility-associated-like protein, partial [Capnocytophaga canimorsus]